MVMTGCVLPGNTCCARMKGSTNERPMAMFAFLRWCNASAKGCAALNHIANEAEDAHKGKICAKTDFGSTERDAMTTDVKPCLA